MKKSAAILTFILLLPFLIVNATPTAKAQDTPTIGDGIKIWSPCNRTYDPNETITVNTSSSTLLGGNIIYSGTYILDGDSPQTLQTESLQIRSWDLFFGALIGTAKLPKLAEGQHKLCIYMKTYIDSTSKSPTVTGEATVYFTIIDLNPPDITLNALDGAVFNQTRVPLNFTVSEPTSWSAYSLDNGAITGIASNATLTVTAGSHTMIVYANDTAGNMGQSKVATFAVQLPEGASETQIGEVTILIAGVLMGLAAILLIYKRRKAKLT
jgi:hypothetical protein